MPAEIHVGDIGTSFRASFKDEEGAIIDISTADTVQIWFEKPSLEDGGTPVVVVKTATLVTDGTDGVARYVSASGDLDRPGNWRIQGFISASGSEVHSDIQKVKIFANLK